jgi:preprotein translocase subunit Sec61beta
MSNFLHTNLINPKEIYTYDQSRYDNMAKKKGEGFHSAAGLIRYFDEEDEKSLKINPWLVVAMCVGSAIACTAAAFIWPV